MLNILVFTNIDDGAVYKTKLSDRPNILQKLLQNFFQII